MQQTELAVAPPAIRAELTGDDRCTALGFTARSSSPVLAICRQLVAAGHDPDQPLEAWRGDVLAVRVRLIGEAAQLRVAGHGIGFEPIPACTTASPVRQTASAVVGQGL